MSSTTRDRGPTNKRQLSFAKRAANAVIGVVFRIVLFVFAVLPRRVSRALASAASWLAWPLGTTARKITERNIAIAFPESSAAEQQRLARESFRQLFWVGAEFGPNWSWSAERLLKCVSSISGEEHLHASLAENRGAIVLVPHLGNWELVGPYLASVYPTTALYKEPRIPVLDRIIRRARQRHGNTLVPADRSGVRALLKALKSRELIAILPDHNPASGGGEFATFFGEPALTMTLVSKLIDRTGCKAVFAYAARQPDNSYQIVIRPADEGMYSADRATALRALNKSVEQCVLDCPEQYRWEYKRYKYLPDYSRRESY